MFVSAFVLIWMRNSRITETWCPDSPSAARVSIVYADHAPTCRPTPITNRYGLTSSSSVAAFRKPGISGNTKT
jgi:hypothetical protein